MNLVYKHEKSLLIIAAIISAIIWLAVILGTFGIALVYILFGYLFFLFAHATFISHLKGVGVKISEEQYPDLHERLVRTCNTVGLKEIPEAYLLRTDFFNALATRFLGRHFVVIYTDVIDALADNQEAIDFYFGHEVGHIHRKHIIWSSFLMPASIFPLLGAALRRAEEYTCDRYGVAVCKNEENIKAALAAIAAGNTRWKTINLNAYLQQIEFTSGFWMSFNELTGDYPWLTKRMAVATALSRGEEVEFPRRHGFAWFLAIFIPRFGMGGSLVSLVMLVAIIGILAAVALPAYQEFNQRAQIAIAYSDTLSVQTRVNEYVEKNHELPTSMQALGYDSESIVDAKKDETSIGETGIIQTKIYDTKSYEDKYILLEPTLDEDANVSWVCSGQNISEKLLPKSCQ